MASGSGSGSESAGVKRKASSNGNGISLAKKAFLESKTNRIDFASIGKKMVSQLAPGLKRASFRARLVMATRGVSPEKKLHFISLVFLDGTGEIRGTIWKENLDFWQSRLIVDNIYDVSSFQIIASDMRYSRLPNKSQLLFEKFTKCDIVKVALPYFPALDWKSLKSLDEVEWLKPDGKTGGNEEEDIIVDIFGMVVDFSASTGVQQLVLRSEVDNQQVFLGFAEKILCQLGDYEKLLVRNETIVRVKGVKMWKFDPPLQGDLFQDSIIQVVVVDDRNLPKAFRDWYIEVTSENLEEVNQPGNEDHTEEKP